MRLTSDDVRKVIGARKAPAEIRKALRAAGIRFDDRTAMDGYFNVRIPTENGEYIRVYKNRRKDVVVQAWTKCVIKWSGIPTFEPSGRWSF